MLVRFKVLTIILIAFVGGCASLSQSECISANWYDLGESNALDGKKSDFIAEHFAACAKHQITPDLVEYKIGWLQGVKKFCTAQSGWRFGLTRRQYQNTCSVEQEKLFVPAYRLAKKVLAKRREISEYKSDLRRLHRYLYSDSLERGQYSAIAFDRMDLNLSIDFLEMDLRKIEQQAQALGLY